MPPNDQWARKNFENMVWLVWKISLLILVELWRDHLGLKIMYGTDCASTSILPNIRSVKKQNKIVLPIVEVLVLLFTLMAPSLHLSIDTIWLSLNFFINHIWFVVIKYSKLYFNWCLYYRLLGLVLCHLYLNYLCTSIKRRIRVGWIGDQSILV